MAHVVLANLPDTGARIRAIADVRRAHVVVVDLSGAKGREQTKTRCCVVVSNDKINTTLSTLIVVPITSHDGTGKVAAYEVELKAGDGELLKASAAQPIQVRTIDEFERIKELWGTLSEPP